MMSATSGIDGVAGLQPAWPVGGRCIPARWAGLTNAGPLARVNCAKGAILDSRGRSPRTKM